MKRLITVILLNLALTVSVMSQTETAQRLYQEAMADRSNIERFLEQDFSAVDSVSIHDLGVLFYLDNDYKSAGACWEIALRKVVKHGKAYEKILNSMSYVYSELNDLEKMQMVMDLIEEHNKHEIGKKCTDYKCEMDHAEYYIMKGDEANAKKSIANALKMCETEEQFIEVEERYAKIMFDTKDYESCAQYYRSAYQRWKRVGKKTSQMGRDIYWAAQNYLLASKYQTAEECSREAMEFFKTQENDTVRRYYVMSISSLGDALYCQQKDVEALEVFSQGMLEYEKWTPNTEEHADALEDVAKVETRLKQYEEAKKHYKAALEIYRNIGEDNKYSNTYTMLTICLRKSGDNEGADQMEKEAEERRRNVYRNLLETELPSLETTRRYLSSLVYTNSLNTVASCYFGVDNYAESAKYFSLYSESLRDMLREQFVVMTEVDRQRLWKEQQQNIDNFCFDLSVLPDTVSDVLQEFIPTFYDFELLSKGIMLNSSIEFEKVLHSMNNKNLTNIYEHVKENQKKIDELQAAPSEENLQKVLDIKRQNVPLEQTLMEGCKAYKDYTQYLSFTWKDVQKRLGAEDIAIEFATVEMSPLDKDIYLLALILKNTGEPMMEVISTKAIVKNLEMKADLYDNPTYYELFWGFMQKHLEGKKRVFFASNNIISNIAIEYLTKDGETFFERYDAYRLSSTKELCREYIKPANNRLCIFGDIDYNTELVSEKKDAVSFGKLIYSKEEIEGIADSVKGKYKVQVFDGKKATEKKFLSVSDKCPAVLHVSSHGAYFGDSETDEEDAMEMSILALAGANVPGQPEEANGKVRASDVAKMNLRECDLVVLSACETGVGGLGEDGVFGLQRGFKNAGVHTLLMSLKSVYDEATAKLMVAFYGGLARGLTKREALKEAQKRLRKEEKYSKGEYWAPFILLDALE